MVILLFLIAISASTIGAISGIGGGVIIKPVLDGFTSMSPATVSFMSCCTVLAMAVSSYIRGLKSSIKLDYHISLFLAFGAALGGVCGKTIFSLVTINVTFIQSFLLLILNIGVFLYIKNKSKIATLNVQNSVISFIIGLILGVVSSFLGIGGGPINIAV